MHLIKRKAKGGGRWRVVVRLAVIDRWLEAGKIADDAIGNDCEPVGSVKKELMYVCLTEGELKKELGR